MKYFLLILMSISLTSCFVFDKIPGEVRVTIDKSIVSDIDSVFLIDNSQYVDLEERNSVKVISEIKDYSFYSSRQNARIKIKLKDSKEYFSDSTITQGSEGEIKISRVDNKVKFEKIVRTNFQKYAPLILIVLLIVLITKVPVALLIIWPSSRIKFLMYYGGLNMIYLIIFILSLILFSDAFVVFLYPFYLIVLISDLFFFVKYYQEKRTFRLVIAAIVSNLLFLTVGQFIITFAIMNNI
ncbi:MAG: hypothetical protein SNJ71_00915 [Bacteroidales bacterium]